MMKRIVRYVRLLMDLNILNTIYINFKILPFRTACKLPIYIFGKVVFANLTGNVRLPSNSIRRGMIQFGCHQENILATNDPTRIYLAGNIYFNGEVKFGYATQTLVLANGVLEIGNNSWFGSFTKLIVFRSVKIGQNLLSSWECQIFDTDFHLIENVIDKTYSDPNGEVVIGENVWLSSRVNILKNTKIPDDCIIALGSICNRDYSKVCEKGYLIGGIPAKPIKKGIRYLNNKNLERKLLKHFENPQNYNQKISV